jgi:CheY-like chemotaxis protein
MPALQVEGISKNAGAPLQLGGLLKGRRILLIEDVAATRRALTAVLEEASAHVDAVDSAPAAWEVYERQRPDVIVSDLGLPTIDGYAFLRQIRETESHLKTNSTPAVALTAFAGESVYERALKSGFQACLTKPVEPMNLVTSLMTLLNAERSPAGK